MAEAAPGPTDGYSPIEDYGVIGNLETVALVCLSGSIDFFCFPDFDSPSIFARILDRENGGHFSITPTGGSTTSRQLYLPDTNILLTRFLSDEGILEITDFMPLSERQTHRQIIRIVRMIKGEMDIAVDCRPRFDYARVGSRAVQDRDSRSVLFEPGAGGLSPARLYSTVQLEVRNDRATAHLHLSESDCATFVFLCRAVDDSTESEERAVFSPDVARALQEDTAEFWRNWIGRSLYRGRWRSAVSRSALALKMLFSHEHGSIVAAPTFSLPETIGGSRNWDYRYCWIRDSAFTIYALLNLGFTDEAGHYIEWVSERYRKSDGDGALQLMYRENGGSDIKEQTLAHLEGYMGSKPVRIGNAAAEQLQLDIYGELIDSIYLAHKFSSPMSYAGWGDLTRTIEYVCRNWQEPDEGIWEFRGGRRHFLHSRLMCWVALDRALKISSLASLPAPADRWRETRDRIFADIHENFWDEDMQSFVQAKGTKAVDASLLLMPMMKFISPVDSRWTRTMECIERELVTDAFVKRYNNADRDLEGFEAGDEGSFIMCSFWYAECLARSGRIADARLTFEKTLGYANHLGLYSEELGPHGQHLGNFPQAFTHLALISTAFALERAIKNGGQPF
jgi:GH15 family glucan-1,4-alpha-glucosidase